MQPLNTDDIKLADYPLLALFKGDWKTGKSIAAHAFPNSYTFLFDIGRMPAVMLYYKKNFKYNTFDDLRQVNDQLDDFKKNGCPYKTLIIDSLTRFGVLAEQCMIDFRIPNQKTDSKTIRAGIPMTEIEDYGGVYRAQVMMVNSLISLHLTQRVHVIVICHVIEVESMNIRTKQATIQRSILTAGKKAAAVLPVDFNEVYHFYANPSTNQENPDSEFVAWTVSNGADWASSAFGLSPKIEWTNKDFYEEVSQQLRGKDMWR